MNEQPNIVVCICDQLRWAEVGCYGNPVVRTPHIDRLAAEGVRFETAVTNYPVCMAARSVLLSGQHNRTCTGGVSNVAYPGRAGDFSMPEYPDAGRPHLKDPTLAEALRGRGYCTRVIGKWHIHSWPNDIGFDAFLIPRVHHCHSGQSFTENGGPEFVPPGYSVDFEADRVERFLDSPAARERPFFLYYSISPPHCPLSDAPEKYLAMYRPEDIPLRPNVDLSKPLARQDYWFKVYRWDFRYYNLHLPFAERLPAGYDLRRLIAEYYGLTTWMDVCVGRMLAGLQRNGLAENTIVVFTSDHGDCLGSLGLVQKGSPNDESIRIPLVVRWPAGLGRPARVVTGQVASLVDVMPTLLGLAGGAIPATAQGRDLAPVVRGDRRALDRTDAVIEMGTALAVRTLTHTCSVPRDRTTGQLAPAPDFFANCVRDPFQQRNLAGTGEEEDTARTLHARLRDWDQTTPWMR